jgi:hypothetical protein
MHTRTHTHAQNTRAHTHTRVATLSPTPSTLDPLSLSNSGSIDYDEFRHIWAVVANVRQELANRGHTFSKFVPTYVLRNKLKKILDEEEDREEEALAHAESWKKWQDMLIVKKKVYAEARLIADSAMAMALDAAGQVGGKVGGGWLVGGS